MGKLVLAEDVIKDIEDEINLRVKNARLVIENSAVGWGSSPTVRIRLVNEDGETLATMAEDLPFRPGESITIENLVAKIDFQLQQL